MSDENLYQRPFSGKRRKFTSEPEDDAPKDLTVYTSFDHLQCQWKYDGKGTRCRMPASTTHRRERRLMKGRDGAVVVTLGHCGFHAQCISNGDFKIGDQMLLTWERNGYPEIPESCGRDHKRYEHAVKHPSVLMEIALELAKTTDPHDRELLMDEMRWARRQAGMHLSKLPYDPARRSST